MKIEQVAYDGCLSCEWQCRRPVATHINTRNIEILLVATKVCGRLEVVLLAYVCFRFATHGREWKKPFPVCVRYFLIYFATTNPYTLTPEQFKSVEKSRTLYENSALAV